MGKLLLMAALALASLPVAGGGGSGAERASAKAIAKAIEKHYEKVKTLRAVFLETYRAGEGDLRVESGTVYFQRPGRMRWDYESPEKKLFLTDGHHAWFYIPANHTASRAPMRESADWRTPFALLTGRARLGEICRKVSIVPNQGGPGAPPAGNTVLDCEPKTGESFVDAQIEVDREARVVRVLVKQAGEIATEVRFGDWRENVALPKSLFTFVPPKDVSVVDENGIAGAKQ